MLFAQSGQVISDSLKVQVECASDLMRSGKLDQGSALAWECLRKAQKTGLHAVVGRAFHLLAGASFNIQDYTQARSYAQHAFEAYQKAGDMRGMGNAYQIVGVMMLSNKQLDSAFYYAQESARCYESAGFEEGVALAYTRMGHVFNLKGEYEKATPYYLRSYEISRTDTFSTGFMNANLSLASNYIYRKQYDPALRHALKACEIAQKLNSFYEKNTSLEYISHIYEQIGDYKKALAYGQMFSAAKDSVLNKEKLQQIKELEVKYETAEKQAAIQLLEKDKANQRALLWAGGFILLLLVAGIVLVGRFYRQRNKALAIAQMQTEQLLQIEQLEAERLAGLDMFKSRFFTNISHEFRTPLTVILGMAEQLNKHFGEVNKSVNTTLQIDVAHTARIIQRNGEHLLRLINQILDLAKLEANTLKMNYIQGDMATYLPYLAESLYSLAEDKGVALLVEVPDEAIKMDHDPEHMRQVVHNLLTNAIKFTKPGGTVVFRLGRTNEGLVFEVSDTGVGIAAVDLPRIFDRFYQATNTQNTMSGSGIGLSLTRELVRAMGGSIKVSSIEGKGTTFAVILPITNQAQTVAEAPILVTNRPVFTPTTEEVDPSAGDFGDLPTLLVVEDNPDIAEYLRSCLFEQYQVMMASNGRAGIEKALETVPDLILSDVMMPEKDGLELCDALKNDERTSHIPIVLLTAKADVESRLAGLQRGADAYLAKPFYPNELTLVLKNLLTLRQRWQRHFAPSVAGLDAVVVPDMTTQDFTPENTFLNKVKEKIAQHCDDPQFDGPRLARAMLLSEVQLYRKIKALTGQSTALYIRSLRLQKGMELLRSTTLTISEIAYDVGFEDPNYFSRTFAQEFGMAPSEFRK